MRKTIALLVFAALSALASPTFAAPSYPMAADEFQETITRRIEATWDRIEKKLVLHKVSEERRDEIRRAFDEAVVPVTEAMDKAAQDGNITRGEAWRINTMTSGLRGKLRGKLAVERAPSRARKPAPESAEDAATRKPSSDKKTKKGGKPAAKQVGRKPAPAGRSNADEELDSVQDSANAKPTKKKRS